MASVITKASHGFSIDDPIYFGNLVPSDCGIVEGQTYYVIASNFSASTFSFSETIGGAGFDLDFDITDGIVSALPTYSEVSDGVMDPPTTPSAPAGPTLSSANVSGVVRLRIEITGTPEPKHRAWEVQVTSKFDGTSGDPDWSTPLVITMPTNQQEASIPCLGGTVYAVRVREQDVYGNFSAFSDAETITTEEGSDSLAAALAAIANGVDGRVIDSTNILPNSIETGMIQANAITADLLAATIVLSSLIQAGDPDGRHVEIDTEGIRLVDADDQLVVNIPTDSTKPVYFRGEVVAESFSSQSENDLSGAIGVTGDAVMTLANGVSAPATSPTATAVGPTALPFSGAPGSIAQPGLSYDLTDGVFWLPADPSTGYVAHCFDAVFGTYVSSIAATGSTTTVTTTFGNTSHISDTAEATDSNSESQIATPIVMPRDGRITKVSIYLAGHNDSPSIRNAVWSNGGTLIDYSAAYFAADEGATGVGDSHQYNKALVDGGINYIGGTTYKVGAMWTTDANVGWQWDRDDGSSKTTYLGSGEGTDDFTVTRTETTHKPNVYITYEYDVDSRLETQAMIAACADADNVYTLDVTGVVWKYDKTTGDHVAHSSVQTAISGTKANAGMFYDATADELIITTFTGTGAGVYPKFVRVNKTTLAVSSTVYSAAAGTTFNGTNDVVRGGCRVTDDVNGGGAATYWIATYTAALVGKVYAYTFSGTTATQVSDRDFGLYANMANGLAHTTGVDSTGYFYGRSGASAYQYTRWDWTTASAIYWFAHAWYDDAATIVTGGTAAAATNLVSKASHGLSIGDKVQFTTLTGGTGLSLATDYYVIASGFTASVFKVSTTSGGSEVDITVDYSNVAFRTIYETAISPRSSLTLRRRESVLVSHGGIPTGGASDPNKVRIYFKPNATDPGAGGLKRQITDASTSRLFITYASSGAADGQGTAFPAGSPASIVSSKALGTTGGALGWALYGDGSMRGPYPKVTVIAASGSTSNSGNWTKPTGIHHIIVECVGGGGGGAGAANSSAGNASLGTSGGGGGYARKLFTATDLAGASTFAYVAGGGGAGVSGATAPNAGTDSTFAGTGISTVTGSGGGAGIHLANGNSTLQRIGGAGGGASNGDINVTGQPASDGLRSATPLASSGTGGSSVLGGGGRSVTSATGNDAINGNAGNNYGGGASGAIAQGGGTAKTGGTGGPGVVIITEFYAP